MAEGDAIVTSTGRAYLVLYVRVARTGRYAGVRKHIRAVVTHDDDLAADVKRHELHWYPREKA